MKTLSSTIAAATDTSIVPPSDQPEMKNVSFSFGQANMSEHYWDGTKIVQAKSRTQRKVWIARPFRGFKFVERRVDTTTLGRKSYTIQWVATAVPMGK